MRNSETSAPRAALVGLIIGSIGVVYGDIGTSPLYALRESLAHQREGMTSLTEEAVIGAISLLDLRPDIHRNDQIRHLPHAGRQPRRRRHPFVDGAGADPPGRRLERRSFCSASRGAALFAGDAIITPAISVMSAIEGLELVTHRFSEFVLPITIFILVTLFWVQSHGTARVAAFFGPIMIVFFLDHRRAGRDAYSRSAAGAAQSSIRAQASLSRRPTAGSASPSSARFSSA